MTNLRTLPKCIRMCMTIGNLPTSYTESLTYEEQLLWFCKFLQEEVIPVVNNNSEVVLELQNWFKTLDVQEEINKKLEEMAQSGELLEIITAYLNIKSQLCYNTVEEMKEATNLTNGSFAKTYGYYNYNDGGGSLYKIRTVTNEDTVDNMFLIALQDSSLVAELVIENNTYNILQVGCKGDSVFDNSNMLQYLVNKIPLDSIIYIPSGVFYCSAPITMKHNISVIGEETSIYNSIPTSCLKFASDGFKGRYNYRIENINFLGINKNGTAIHEGETFIKNCHINNFATGIYTLHTGVIESCHIYGNGTGIDGVIDSRIINNFIYANEYNGIRLYQGCNDNIITNNKIEWNSQHGIEIYIANYNVISNNIFDRNTKYGIEMKGANNTNIIGNTFKRNYIDNTPDDNHSHVLIYESHNINFNGNNTIKGNSQDDGQGVECPYNSLTIYSSTHLNLIGNDLNGSTGIPISYDGTISYIKKVDSDKDYSYTKIKNVHINSTTPGTITLENLGVPNQYSMPIYADLVIQARTGNSGSCSFMKTTVFAYKGWGGNEIYLTNNILNDQITLSVAYDGNTPTLTFTTSGEDWNINVIEKQ